MSTTWWVENLPVLLILRLHNRGGTRSTGVAGRRGQSGDRLWPLAPGASPDCGAHRLIEREGLGIVGAPNQVEPLKLWRIVALEIRAGLLPAALRVQEDNAVDDPATCQLRPLAAADIGRVAVKPELENRLAMVVPGPGDVGDDHAEGPAVDVW